MHALCQIMSCQVLIGNDVCGVYSNYFMENVGSSPAQGAGLVSPVVQVLGQTQQNQELYGHIGAYF